MGRFVPQHAFSQRHGRSRRKSGRWPLHPQSRKIKLPPVQPPLKRKGIPLEWVNDVLVAGEIPEPAPLDNPGLLDLEGRILKAVSHAVNVLGWKFAADPASTNYLPGKLARQKNWQHIAWVDLVATLDRLLTEGRLVKALVKDAWLLRLPDDAPYPGEVKRQ
jgi:hypothetical protein